MILGLMALAITIVCVTLCVYAWRQDQRPRCPTCKGEVRRQQWVAGLQDHYCSEKCAREWARHVREDVDA